jgi:hypothetical protein
MSWCDSWFINLFGCHCWETFLGQKTKTRQALNFLIKYYSFAMQSKDGNAPNLTLDLNWTSGCPWRLDTIRPCLPFFFPSLQTHPPKNLKIWSLIPSSSFFNKFLIYWYLPRKLNFRSHASPIRSRDSLLLLLHLALSTCDGRIQSWAARWKRAEKKNPWY